VEEGERAKKRTNGAWYGEKENQGKIRKRKRECMKQEGYTTLIKRHSTKLTDYITEERGKGQSKE